MQSVVPGFVSLTVNAMFWVGLLLLAPLVGAEIETAGGVVSIVIVRGAEGALWLPAASVAVPVSV
jgi:hypothetical protein